MINLYRSAQAWPDEFLQTVGKPPPRRPTGHQGRKKLAGHQPNASLRADQQWKWANEQDGIAEIGPSGTISEIAAIENMRIERGT